MAVAQYPPFSLKVGDLARPIKYQLTDGDGNPVDLSLATSISFKMTQNGSGTKVVGPASATIVTAVTGIVQYSWQAGDTSVAGSYRAEFTVNWSGGTSPDTFPSDGYIDVEIMVKV